MDIQTETHRMFCCNYLRNSQNLQKYGNGFKSNVQNILKYSLRECTEKGSFLISIVPKADILSESKYIFKKTI